MNTIAEAVVDYIQGTPPGLTPPQIENINLTFHSGAAFVLMMIINAPEPMEVVEDLLHELQRYTAKLDAAAVPH